MLQQLHERIVRSGTGASQQRQATFGVATVAGQLGEVQQRQGECRVQGERRLVRRFRVHGRAEPFVGLAAQPPHRRPGHRGGQRLERVGEHAEGHRAVPLSPDRLDQQCLRDPRFGQLRQELPDDSSWSRIGQPIAQRGRGDLRRVELVEEAGQHLAEVLTVADRLDHLPDDTRDLAVQPGQDDHGERLVTVDVVQVGQVVDPAFRVVPMQVEPSRHDQVIGKGQPGVGEQLTDGRQRRGERRRMVGAHGPQHRVELLRAVLQQLDPADQRRRHDVRRMAGRRRRDLPAVRTQRHPDQVTLAHAEPPEQVRLHHPRSAAHVLVVDAALAQQLVVEARQQLHQLRAVSQTQVALVVGQDGQRLEIRTRAQEPALDLSRGQPVREHPTRQQRGQVDVPVVVERQDQRQVVTVEQIQQCAVRVLAEVERGALQSRPQLVDRPRPPVGKHPTDRLGDHLERRRRRHDATVPSPRTRPKPCPSRAPSVPLPCPNEGHGAVLSGQ